MATEQINLHFRKMGQGPDLVILHGLFGSCDNWLSVARLLEPHYTLWLLDQRNHGRSPHSAQWDYNLMAADLKHFIDTHQIERPAILGHSMGGKTVMQFAISYPDIARCLIIADIGPKQYPSHHQTILEGLKSINLSALNERKEADSQLSKYVRQAEVRQFLLKNLYRNEQENFEWRINLPVISDKIDQVGMSQNSPIPCQTPTLFLRGGESDYIVLPDDQAGIKTLFANSSIETIKDAGHWLHAQKPVEFAEKVLRFLGLH